MAFMKFPFLRDRTPARSQAFTAWQGACQSFAAFSQLQKIGEKQGNALLPLCPFDVPHRFTSRTQALSCLRSREDSRMLKKVTPMKHHVYSVMPSPVGRLKLVASDKGLAAILWENDAPGRVRLDIAGKDDSHPGGNQTAAG
jgi:hypothetical protein